MSITQYKQTVTPLFTNHFRTDSHLAERCMLRCLTSCLPKRVSVTSLGAGCTWRSQSGDFQARVIPTTHWCVRSLLTGSLQVQKKINTMSPGAFFNQRGNRHSRCDRSEKNNISSKRGRIFLALIWQSAITSPQQMIQAYITLHYCWIFTWHDVSWQKESERSCFL